MVYTTNIKTVAEKSNWTYQAMLFRNAERDQMTSWTIFPAFIFRYHLPGKNPEFVVEFRVAFLRHTALLWICRQN